MKPGVAVTTCPRQQAYVQGLPYYLEGMMVPLDMPEVVVNGVIERAEATATRLYAEDSKTKRAKKRRAGGQAR